MSRMHHQDQCTAIGSVFWLNDWAERIAGEAVSLAGSVEEEL